MQRTFEKRLIDLLPPVYREQDTTGDLAAFLALPAAALDDLKDLADRFPEIFDVDRCEERFLPFLAALVGWPWEPTQDAARQRRQIREAVEFYRRKGTIPAIRRSLVDIGWEGWIEETFRSAFRLNRRARLNTKKLPGEIYSYGVYRIHSTEQPPDLWVGLRPHHPAGMRVFFLRLLQLAGALDGTLEGYANTLVRMVSLGRLHEAFVLNRSQLNGHDPLTGRERAPVLMIASQMVFARQGFERAQTCVRSWHARTPCLRLNRSRLNRERLANVWVSELISAWCCCVSVEGTPSIPPPVIVLNHPRLNRARLNRTGNCCGVHHRQRDFVTVDDAPLSEALQTADGLALVSHARLDPRLTLGRSLLGGPEHLAGERESLGKFAVFDV